MELASFRYSSQVNDTLSIWMDITDIEPHEDEYRLGGEFLNYGLEDEFRIKKVSGETRIPANRYRILLRPPHEGNVNARYAAKFPDMHRGMLWLQDVDGFTWIYIHMGNDDEHSEGCLLVGDDPAPNHVGDHDGKVWNSSDAYVRLYKRVIAAMDEGEEVWITVINMDTPKELH